MQTLVNAIYGVGVGAGLWLLGVPYPLLWGVAAGVLRFIPYRRSSGSRRWRRSR